MSAAPIYYGGTPRIGQATVPGTADTSLTAPTNVSDVIVGAASGTMVTSIEIIQIATTSAAGIINLFLYDGTNHVLFDSFAFQAVTLSATTASTPNMKYYRDLILPNASWKIRTTVTVTGGVSAFKVIAFGADA
jgi:hypothetical protein